MAIDLERSADGWQLVLRTDAETACTLPGVAGKGDNRPVEDLDLAPKTRMTVPVAESLVPKWKKRLRRAVEKGKKEDPVVAKRLKELEKKLAGVNKSWPAKDNKTDHGRRAAINYIEVKIHALKEKLYLPTPALGYPWVVVEGTKGLFTRTFFPHGVHMAPNDPWPLERIPEDGLADVPENPQVSQNGG